MNVIRIAEYSMNSEGGSLPVELRRMDDGSWILSFKKTGGEDLRIFLSEVEVKQLHDLFAGVVGCQ
jgi:hypothetical protein